jgi:protein SCO1/2
MKNSLIFIVMVAVAVVAGLYFFSEKFNQQHLPQEGYSGEAQIGGGFTLTDQNGKQVSDSQFRGKYMLVFFGFTSCPSICPVGLATITQVMEKLGDNSSKIQPVFITVDPETDTPEQMKQFLTNFHSAIVGLTGTQEQITAVGSAYKVYASKSKDKNMPAGYNVDHSGFIYLMDKNGKYIEHFAYDVELKKLLNEY